MFDTLAVMVWMNPCQCHHTRKITGFTSYFINLVKYHLGCPMCFFHSHSSRPPAFMLCPASTARAETRRIYCNVTRLIDPHMTVVTRPSAGIFHNTYLFLLYLNFNNNLHYDMRGLSGRKWARLENEDQIVGFLGDLGQRWPYGDGRWVI